MSLKTGLAALVIISLFPFSGCGDREAGAARRTTLVASLRELQKIYPAKPRGVVRLASWNIRKFSWKSRDRWEFEIISRIIAVQQFDLVAIQEIVDPNNVLEKDSALYQLKLRLKKLTGKTWKSISTKKYTRGYPKRTAKGDLVTAGSPEAYGFLWRTDKVKLISSGGIIVELNKNSKVTDLSGMKLDSALSRAPFVATFKARKFDFTLATFHATFGRKAYPNGNSATKSVKAVDIRREIHQLDNVLEAIQEANGPENDVILMGDFNGNLEDSSWKDFEKGDWIPVFSEPDTQRTVVRGGNLYDNVIFSGGYSRREFKDHFGVYSFDNDPYVSKKFLKLSEKDAQDLISKIRKDPKAIRTTPLLNDLYLWTLIKYKNYQKKYDEYAIFAKWRKELRKAERKFGKDNVGKKWTGHRWYKNRLNSPWNDDPSHAEASDHRPIWVDFRNGLNDDDAPGSSDYGVFSKGTPKKERRVLYRLDTKKVEGEAAAKSKIQDNLPTGWLKR